MLQLLFLYCTCIASQARLVVLLTTQFRTYDEKNIKVQKSDNANANATRNSNVMAWSTRFSSATDFYFCSYALLCYAMQLLSFTIFTVTENIYPLQRPMYELLQEKLLILETKPKGRSRLRHWRERSCSAAFHVRAD